MTKEEFINEVRQVMEPLRRFLTGLCAGDSFTADDIAQDALAKAWVSTVRFKTGTNFKSWIFRIGYNTWLNQRYKSAGTSLSEESYSVPDTGRLQDSEMEDTETGGMLYRSIASLTPNEKAAVLLFYMEDKSISDIADILGTSAGSVKMLLSRGRENIRQFMTRNNYGK